MIIFNRILSILGGANALLANKITNIEVESLDCAKSAAEGAGLGVFTYQGQKATDKRLPTATLSLANGADGSAEWAEGTVLANAQNWART